MKLVYSEIWDQAWKSIKDDLALVAGLSLVFWIAAIVLMKIPFVGMIFVMPLSAGYLRCLIQIRKRETIGYQDFFWGYLDVNRLIHLILMNVIISFGLVFGTILLVIPGIWWMIATAFALQVFLLKSSDCVESVKTSMALVKGRWWNVAGFCLVTGMIIFAGLICLFIGFLVTLPLGMLSMLIAAEKLMQTQQLSSDVHPTSQSTSAPVETTIIPQ